MARLLSIDIKTIYMNNFFRTIIAAWGAKKLGGGCLSTIIIFFVIYWALGNCNSHPAAQHASLEKHPQAITAMATHNR